MTSGVSARAGAMLRPTSAISALAAQERNIDIHASLANRQRSDE
jgi:hypothetical protein